MDKRLQRFLEAENITQSQLAEKLGVAKAGISHILAGRNKPSFEFILSMANNYPNLNLDWLITGKGKMYNNRSSTVTTDSSEEQQFSSPNGKTAGKSDSQGLNLFPNETENPENKQLTASISPTDSKQDPPRIRKILIFYDNGTFKEVD
jgi:transcriptional regulator with XRE-family HTH domain